MLFLLRHMFTCRKAVRQDLSKRMRFHRIQSDHVDDEIIGAEFPHDLTAHTAGRERARNNPILAAADRNGYKIPVSIINRLKKSSPLSTVGRAIGGIFDVAALIDCPIGAQQRSTYFEF